MRGSIDGPETFGSLRIEAACGRGRSTRMAPMRRDRVSLLPSIVRGSGVIVGSASVKEIVKNAGNKNLVSNVSKFVGKLSHALNR